MDTPRANFRSPFGDSAAHSTTTSLSDYPADRISIADGGRTPTRQPKHAFKSYKLRGE